MYIGVIYARAWASDLFHARLVYFRSDGLSLRGGAVYRERDRKSIVDKINGQGACFLASLSSLDINGRNELGKKKYGSLSQRTAFQIKIILI